MKTPIALMACAGLFLSPPAAAFDPFARELDSVEAGNQSYGEQHFDQALDLYEQAEQEVEQEPRVHFNRGAALFKLGRPKEAREAYLRASGLEDPQMKKQNYYNIGNTFLAEGALQDAIPYYRRALEIDPGFDDARFNLELALRALEQQQQQQQQQQDGQSDQQDQKEGQDQKKDEQQKDEEKEGSEDQGKDEKEKEDQQQGDQKEQKEQEKDQQQQQDQQDQKDQEGQQDQKEQEKGQEQEQEKDQQAQKQEGMQDQQGDQQEQKEQEKKEEQQAGQPKPQPEKIPGQLSQAEFRDLLDSMRDSEKPFQMHKFELPEYRQQQTEKDW